MSVNISYTSANTGNYVGSLDVTSGTSAIPVGTVLLCYWNTSITPGVTTGPSQSNPLSVTAGAISVEGVDAAATRSSTHDSGVLRAVVTTEVPANSTFTYYMAEPRSRVNVILVKITGIDNVCEASSSKVTGGDGNVDVGPNGSSATPSASTQSATTTASSLVMYYGTVSGSRTTSVDSPLTEVGQIKTSVGSADRGLVVGWKEVTTTGVQTGGSTMSASSSWAAGISTYPISTEAGSAPIARFWADASAVMSTTATMDLPASIPSGSVGVAVSGWDSSASPPTPPTGWTQLEIVTVTETMNAHIYWRAMQASDSNTTVTFNADTGNMWYKKFMSIAIYTGVAVEAPLYAYNINTSGSTVASPSVAVSSSSAAYGVWSERSSSPSSSSTAPSGLTKIDEEYTTGGGSVSGAIADNLTTSSTSVGGSGNWTANQSNGSVIALTFALKASSSTSGSSGSATVVIGGVKKTIANQSVIVGGVKKPVVNKWVIVGGVKKTIP